MLGLRMRKNLGLGLVVAIARFGLGLEVEAGEGQGTGLEPGLELGHFSLWDSGASPSFFPGTPPPREVLEG